MISKATVKTKGRLRTTLCSVFRVATAHTWRERLKAIKPLSNRAPSARLQGLVPPRPLPRSRSALGLESHASLHRPRRPSVSGPPHELWRPAAPASPHLLSHRLSWSDETTTLHRTATRGREAGAPSSEGCYRATRPRPGHYSRQGLSAALADPAARWEPRFPLASLHNRPQGEGRCRLTSLHAPHSPQPMQHPALRALCFPHHTLSHTSQGFSSDHFPKKHMLRGTQSKPSQRSTR